MHEYVPNTVVALSAALLLGNAAMAQADTAPSAFGVSTPTAVALPQSTSLAPSLLAPTTHSASPSAAPPTAKAPLPAPDANWTAEAAISFWTPQRLASATDPGA